MDLTRLAASLLEPVPAHATFGLRVQRADATGAEVTLDLEAHMTNVIGSLHSSGVAALVDAAGLAAIIGAAETAHDFDGVTPLGTDARLEFLRPARGRLTGRCTLTAADRDGLRPLLAGDAERAGVRTEVTITNAADQVVARGAFAWKLRRFAVPADAAA